MKRSSAGIQIPLKFAWREAADFEHFIEDRNSEVCAIAKAVARGECYHSIYLWGRAATGKSHILQAVCNLASLSGLQAVYIPLKRHAEFAPAIFEGLDSLGIVCVDDIDTIAGDDAWERALFGLFNRLREHRKPLLMTGSTGPGDVAFHLRDLKSRIAWDLIYRLSPLADRQKIRLLQKRAHARTFELPEAVATYLVKHVKRDLPFLLELLDRFDQATLAEKRKLTVPFVKALLRDG